MPILRLTDGEERLLLSVYDLWQHKRVLMSQITRERRMRILSLNQTVVQKITASIKLMANNHPALIEAIESSLGEVATCLTGDRL